MDSVQSEFCFSLNGEAPTGNWYRTKLVITEEAGLTEDWEVRDIRRSVATRMQRLGTPREVIEAALAHRSGRSGLVGVYQTDEYVPERRQALEKWALHLEGLLSGKQAAVVPFRQSA